MFKPSITITLNYRGFWRIESVLVTMVPFGKNRTLTLNSKIGPAICLHLRK